MSKQDPDSFRMPFGDHLDELRSCLIRALVGVLAATIICLEMLQRSFSMSDA